MLSPILILVGLNALHVPEGALRATLNFAVVPVLAVLAKFFSLGWRDRGIGKLGVNGQVLLFAILLHLMFSEYSHWPESGSSYIREFLIDDFLRAEPGVDVLPCAWLGLIVPVFIFPILGIRALMTTRDENTPE